MAMKSEVSIKEVISFWDKNPLFEGESKWATGSYDFFIEHRNVIINDFFNGEIPEFLYPPEGLCDDVLDLGCGPGFWTVEFLLNREIKTIVSCDLTSQALKLTKKRMFHYEYNPTIIQGNAEILPFKDNSFSFINCQGVIHHTPYPKKCIEEMNRITKPGGMISVSVYYLNFFLRHWDTFKFFGSLAHRCGIGIKGRGRESLFLIENPNELIRNYDGSDNPLGIGFSYEQFHRLIENCGFEVKKIYYISAPSRILPNSFPRAIHNIYKNNVPYMIGALLKKY